MSVRIRRRVAGLVVAAALLAGCQPAAVPPSVVPSVVPTTSSPSPTPSPTPSLTAEQAAIKAGMLRYLEVYEKFARDPSLTELSETQYVTTGDESIMIIRKIDSLRQRGEKYSGSIAYRDFSIGEVQKQGEKKVTIVTYCKDLRDAHLLSIKTGEIVDIPNRPMAFFETAEMNQIPNGAWVVAKLSNKQVAQC